MMVGGYIPYLIKNNVINLRESNILFKDVWFEKIKDKLKIERYDMLILMTQLPTVDLLSGLEDIEPYE